MVSLELGSSQLKDFFRLSLNADMVRAGGRRLASPLSPSLWPPSLLLQSRKLQVHLPGVH